MNRVEAFRILGLSEDCSEETLKKKYKELARTMHPDVNKAPDAESKFKLINEAYAYIQNPTNESSFNGGVGGTNIEDIFNSFNINFAQQFTNQRVQHKQVQNINSSIKISFKESILGCSKQIEIDRNLKCNICHGSGNINECKACDGTGFILQQMGNTIIRSSCTKCSNKNINKKCNNCKSGVVKSTVSLSVSVPKGVVKGNILRLAGVGNYVDSMMGDRYTDVMLNIDVEQDKELSFDNGNVIYNLNITLLEALKGCEKSVPTIFGMEKIKIPPLSKHNDVIKLINFGVPNKGDQLNKLNINYTNVDKLIDFLENTND